IRTTAGFGFGVGKPYNGTDNTETITTNGIEPSYLSRIYYDQSAGINMNLGILLHLSENIGVEAGGGYIMGQKETTDKNKTDDMANDGLGTTRWEQTMISTLIPVDLTFKIFTKLGPVSPFIGAGPTVLSSGKTIVNRKEYSKQLTDLSTGLTVDGMKETETEMTYKMSFGVNACTGVNINLTKFFALTGGVVYRFIVLKPAKSKITKCEVNGKDQLSHMKTREKETEFKEYYKASENTSDSSPAYALADNYPVSSVIFSAGFAFKF
ncbi:MAG: outer membrane beta-barrel protein, partial [Spirochaetes bacterium]|nr:outer membrane beta-barrel protein [Spirochaetota bacterium]